MLLPRSMRSSAGEVERLIAHIVVQHHDRARFGWPSVYEAIADLAQKVDTVQPLVDAVGGFVDQLESHLRAEEEVLFPHFIALERYALGAAARPPRPSFGSVGDHVAVLVKEHREEELLLERIREATDGYAKSIAALTPVYEVLRTLDADQSRHAFLEDTVLFPAVLRMEQRTRD